MLNFERRYFEEQGVTAEISVFSQDGGVTERHVMLHVEPRMQPFEGQIARIYEVERLLPWKCVMKRYFVSDIFNQLWAIREDDTNAAVSIIQQSPMDGSKVAVWLYFLEGMDVVKENGMTVASHNGYRHLWRMGMCVEEGDSAQQTESILLDYERQLEHFGANLADNCMRTWFVLRDIEANYMGMVKARKENFAQQGLTDKTHFMASTGIEGTPAAKNALMDFGAYALTGLVPDQIEYLYAPAYISSAYEYGVTFERGTKIDFGDRRHVIISGTASITNRGLVVHSGDALQQAFRVLETVEALLWDAECDFSDVVQVIVYLRDVSDYDVMKRLFAKHFPNTPCVITLASVCRPEWLVEMECMAVKDLRNSNYPAF